MMCIIQVVESGDASVGGTLVKVEAADQAGDWSQTATTACFTAT